MRMLSKTGLVPFFDFCGELFLAILSLHSRCFGTESMLAPRQRRVKQNVNRTTKQMCFPLRVTSRQREVSRKERPSLNRLRPLGGRAESEPYSLVNYFRGGLSFTATRRLREDSQCVRGFCAAALLKFVDPVGHRIDHIARRFTCRVLSLACGWSDDLLLTLFDYANCFLLRHCCIFELPVWNLFVSNEFRVTQFPN